jgi:tetratricopeptide (TPR) repeat protein
MAQCWLRKKAGAHFMSAEPKKTDVDNAWRQKLPSAGKAIIGMVALGILGGLYFLLVHSPISDAGAAMRVARYDIALSSIGNIPARFSDWPGVPLYRQKVTLGARTYRETPEWDEIGEDLRRLRAEYPDDPDLMVLEARYWLRLPDYAKAGALAEQAVKADRKHAEAWFVLGLHHEHAGDISQAVEHYRKAADAAPGSPTYRSSLARGLLEMGKPDEALVEFRSIRDFAHARLEEAMAHWAKGDMRQAADAQREALSMLGDAGVSGRYHNRREWMFPVGKNGARLSTVEDKLCYARLGESASRSLAGESAVAFPPAGCERTRQAVREVVAEKLCRFVAKPQPSLGATVSRLRRSLGMSEGCPA